MLLAELARPVGGKGTNMPLIPVHVSPNSRVSLRERPAYTTNLSPMSAEACSERGGGFGPITSFTSDHRSKYPIVCRMQVAAQICKICWTATF